MKQIILFSISILIFNYVEGQTVSDFDGNIYTTVDINGLEWMAENLKTSSFSNGDPILNVTGASWATTTIGAGCHYNDDPNNESTFGRLYNYYTVSDNRNVCPSGWHVPSEAEWDGLINFFGGSTLAGGPLKGTTTWDTPNTGATNSSGFNALAGGLRNQSGFFSKGVLGYFWSSTEIAPSAIWGYGFDNSSTTALKSDYPEVMGFSIRCARLSSAGTFPNSNNNDFQLIGNTVENSLNIITQIPTELTIFSISGQKIKILNLEKGYFEVPCDINPGIYFLKGANHSIRFVKL